MYSDVKDEPCDKVSPIVVELSEAALPSVRYRRCAFTGLGRAAMFMMLLWEQGCAFEGVVERTGGGFDGDSVDDEIEVDDCVDEDEYDRDREEVWLEVDMGEGIGGGGDGGETIEDTLVLLVGSNCC